MKHPKDCKEYKVIEELENKIIDLQQRLDASSEKLKEAVEIIKVIKENLDIDLQCTFSGNTWEELSRQMIVSCDKFLESATALNTSQVDDKEVESE